jgi:site-specific recombinase XerC
MNPSNERLRYAYIEHLRDAEKVSEKTIDAALRHLSELERFISGQDFERLSKSQAKAFSDHLHVRVSKPGTGPLSSSSIVNTMNDLQAFYAWLTTIKGRKVDPEAIARLTASRRAQMDRKSKLDKAPPTPEHIRAMITAIGDQTMLARRDRALVAFIYLTGMRVGAVISLRCKHVKPAARQVDQDATEVNTKFGKNMLTSFFPVGQDIEQIVVDWVKERMEAGAGPDDPLFPAKPRHRLPGDTAPDKHTAWLTTGPVRKVFRDGCRAAGIDYIKPHSVRSTLMLLGLEMCATWEELKAWSQNLGHEKLDTSLVHYGKLDTNRQNDLMQSLVRTDLTVCEEQDLIMSFRRLSPKKRAAVLDLVEQD